MWTVGQASRHQFRAVMLGLPPFVLATKLGTRGSCGPCLLVSGGLSPQCFPKATQCFWEGSGGGLRREAPTRQAVPSLRGTGTGGGQGLQLQQLGPRSQGEGGAVSMAQHEAPWTQRTRGRVETVSQVPI